MAGQLNGMGPHLTRWCEGPHRGVHLCRTDGRWRGTLRYHHAGDLSRPCGIEMTSSSLPNLWDRLERLARNALAAGFASDADVTRALSEPVSIRWSWSDEEVTHG